MRGPEVRYVDQQHAVELFGESFDRHIEQWSRTEHGHCPPPRHHLHSGLDHTSRPLEVRRPRVSLALASSPEADRFHEMAAEGRRSPAIAQQVDDALGQHAALIPAAVARAQQGQ
jgi:hypothetical protein